MASKKKRRPRPDASEPKREREKAEQPAEARPHRWRVALLLLAAAYLVTVWLDGVASSFAARITPRPWLYFGQVAALFKAAGMMSIDYRAEGWSCDERRWVEVDVRPFFRIDADNKENRFYRALQFYRQERKVMRALEDYVLERHNATPGRPTIGGVRFLSLRIPYPKLGAHVEPVQRRPLADVPSEMRKEWYWTPKSRRRERCHDTFPLPSAAPHEPPVKDDEDMTSRPTGPAVKEPEQ